MSMMAVSHHADASARMSSGLFALMTMIDDAVLEWSRSEVASPLRSDCFDIHDIRFQLGVVKVPEELLVGGFVLLDGNRHPRCVQVMLQVDVLGDDVAAPCAATQAG